MKKSSLLILIIFVLACGVGSAQTTAFTYQGKLTDGGMPPTAQYDFTFKLYDLVSGGTQIGSDVAVNDVQVTAGVFTVNLNFGAVPFASGAERFLEIAVRPGASSGAYTMLLPHQPLTSLPFSIRTLSATSADGLSAVCNPCVTDGQIVAVDGAKVTGTVNNSVNAMNAATATNVSGVVQIANGGTGSTTKNFVDLTTNQTIGGRKTFIDPLFGDGSGLTNLNGANLNPGSVTAAQLAPNVSQSNLSLLGSLRWDLLRGQRDFAVGTNPRGIAFDGANMWVVNQNGNNVTRLPPAFP